MTTPHKGTSERRSLDILEISEKEEQAYRWIIAHPHTTVAEVSQALEQAPGKAQRLLDAIEAKGLATHTPERPRHYIPVAPDIALKAIVFRRQEDLQHAEDTIQELQEQAVVYQQGEQEQMIELITSHEAERQIFEQMHLSAQDEIVTFIRPPMRISRLDLPLEEEQRSPNEARARGVRYRSIVDAEFLALPGAVHKIRAETKAGEEVRVIPRLPFKMVLTDHRLAFIPLNLQSPTSPVLLVRSPALLDAFYALFEILWERAAPISFTHTGMLEVGDPASRLPKEAEDLISLMAAGLNDKKIAYELGISLSTLKRRISEIMKVFNARTRFQLGRLTDTPSSGRDSK